MSEETPKGEEADSGVDMVELDPADQLMIVYAAYTAPVYAFSNDPDKRLTAEDIVEGMEAYIHDFRMITFAHLAMMFPYAFKDGEAALCLHGKRNLFIWCGFTELGQKAYDLFCERQKEVIMVPVPVDIYSRIGAILDIPLAMRPSQVHDYPDDQPHWMPLAITCAKVEGLPPGATVN